MTPHSIGQPRSRPCFALRRRGDVAPHLHIKALMWRFVGLATGLLAGCADPCANEISQTVLSPSGQFAAVVFNRNCGATTGFNTQVSIVTSGTVPGEGGNVFIANGSIGLSLQWRGDAELRIAGMGRAAALKREAEASGVKVVYAF